MIGIYKIENKINSKCYVGQSIDIEHRWMIHKSTLNNNTHHNNYLQRAWNKYGEENFEFKILEICSEDELDEKEIEWIDKLHSYRYHSDSNGYNMNIGGDGNRKDCPILQFDLYGNFVNEYKNIHVASQMTGINIQSISGCCKKNHKYAGKYIWIYKNEYKDNKSLDWNFNNSKLRNINQYDLDGNLIKTWSHLKDIVNELHINPQSCLRHVTYTCGGYIFKYVDDNFLIDDKYLYLAKNSLRLTCNKPFYQVDINGDIVNSYLSLSQAKEDGWNERMINECCRGLRPKYKNFLWIPQEEYKYYTPELCKSIIDNKPIRKKYCIEQYDNNHKLIKTYNQLKDVVQDGFLKGNVLDCCLGRKPQYKGYIWKQKYIE